MRWYGRRVQVYAYTRPTDMRKGFDGLCALVTQGLHCDVLSGDIFIFISRDRIRAKTLQWDGTGLCLYAKRLEHGRFAPLWREARDDLHSAFGRILHGFHADWIDPIIEELDQIVLSARDGNFKPTGKRTASKLPSHEVEAFVRACEQCARTYDELSPVTKRSIDTQLGKLTKRRRLRTFNVGRILHALARRQRTLVKRAKRARRRAPRVVKHTQERRAIAVAVAHVLVAHGLRIALKKSSDSAFARVLQVVLEAANLQPPEDLFRTVRPIVDEIESESAGLPKWRTCAKSQTSLNPQVQPLQPK
jgi:tellurite resistance protein